MIYLGLAVAHASISEDQRDAKMWKKGTVTKQPLN